MSAVPAKVEVMASADLPADYPIKLRRWLRLQTISFIYKTLHIVISFDAACFFVSLLMRKAVPNDVTFYKNFVTQYLNTNPTKSESFAKEIFYLRNIYDKHKQNGTLPDNFTEIIEMEDEITAKYERPRRVCRFPEPKDRLPFEIPLGPVHFFQKGLLPILKLVNVPRELNNVCEIGQEFNKFGDLVRVSTDHDFHKAEIYFSQPLAVIMCIRYYKDSASDNSKFKNVEMVAFVNRLQMDQQDKGGTSPDADANNNSNAMLTSVLTQDGALRDSASLRKYVQNAASSIQSSPKSTDTTNNHSSQQSRPAQEKRDTKCVLISNVPDQYHGINFFGTGLITKKEAVKSIREGLGEIGEYYLQIEMHTTPAAIGLLKTISSKKDDFNGIAATFRPVDFELAESTVIFPKK